MDLQKSAKSQEKPGWDRNLRIASFYGEFFARFDCTIVSDATGYLGGHFGGQLGEELWFPVKTTTCPSSSIALALGAGVSGSRFAGKNHPLHA